MEQVSRGFRLVRQLSMFMGLLTLFCLPLWSKGNSEEEPKNGLYAQINTSKGRLLARLDHENAELAVTNFVGLAEGTIPNSARSLGISYFDDMDFYRVAKQYAVFSGDPDGNGEGGPGYTLPRSGGPRDMGAGALLMDGLLSESSGSRFFITLQPDSFLANKFMYFGQVVSGLEVLEKISQGDRIKSVDILRLGIAAEGFIVTAESFRTLYEQERMKEIERLQKVDQNLPEIILELGNKRQKTLSGIYYSIEKEGKGNHPVVGSKLSLEYTGALTDGTVFDSSTSQGENFDFVFGESAIINGWTEMLGTMKTGEKRRVVIPPSMAYGNREFGPIQPGSWLVFDIELLGISTEK